MKTMKMADEVRRIEENEIAEFLRKGWGFCKKSVWKEKVRDKGKTKVAPKEVEKKAKVKDENYIKQDKVPRKPRNA